MGRMPQPLFWGFVSSMIASSLGFFGCVFLNHVKPTLGYLTVFKLHNFLHHLVAGCDHAGVCLEGSLSDD